ncbi:MAG: lytic transglycosylase domain-containing protein [Bryobacteraceae bacterium]
MKLLGAVLLLAANGFAGERAVLSNGFVMRADRHEIAGDQVKLYLNGGSIELSAAQIERFEAEPAPPEPPAAVVQKPAPSARELLAEAARRYGLPARFLESVAKTESGFRNDAVSPKGAIGIMQLMPETARKLGADPTDPWQNVDAGTRFLRDLLLKYQDDDYQVRKALAAYNAGPAAVDRYNGVPPYRETVQYVERIIRQSGRAVKLPSKRVPSRE